MCQSLRKWIVFAVQWLLLVYFLFGQLRGTLLLCVGPKPFYARFIDAHMVLVLVLAAWWIFSGSTVFASAARVEQASPPARVMGGLALYLGWTIVACGVLCYSSQNLLRRLPLPTFLTGVIVLVLTLVAQTMWYFGEVDRRLRR